MAGREHILCSVSTIVSIYSKAINFNFLVFFILCAFQTARGQQTTAQLLKATQAMHSSSKSKLKKIQIPKK